MLSNVYEEQLREYDYTGADAVLAPKGHDWWAPHILLSIYYSRVKLLLFYLLFSTVCILAIICLRQYIKII
jgi:hypothetical protein